eukprot:TRINITY_DN1942_c0_g2_i1.p1 TRINITY_DN1942_c0_g2~~TRINITY_DN1942_c0_g2_i1.p1  ORF type:complete len:226 (+),score=-9.34 TRINITY_DN1942_c0_g2_i1:284-961(+)
METNFYNKNFVDILQISESMETKFLLQKLNVLFFYHNQLFNQKLFNKLFNKSLPTKFYKFQIEVILLVISIISDTITVLKKINKQQLANQYISISIIQLEQLIKCLNVGFNKFQQKQKTKTEINILKQYSIKSYQLFIQMSISIQETISSKKSMDLLGGSPHIQNQKKRNMNNIYCKHSTITINQQYYNNLLQQYYVYNRYCSCFFFFNFVYGGSPRVGPQIFYY